MNKIEDLKRVNLNIEGALCAEIDEFADSMHISTTAAVSMMCSEYLKQRKSIDSLSEFTSLLKANPELLNEVMKQAKAGKK